MHFDLTINLGEVITWAMALGAFCYAYGRLNQRVEGIASDVETLRTDYREHCSQNVEQFENLNRNILAAARPQGGK